ncbi:glycoprotein Xg isoform X6 [Balaenoptera acutorostrata]|uniref:Glycoprotein Xg isoform X6 n=1 Tax=Balaenoptera acutorostrata TaxID=9767 RepID=A0ABM3SYY7_BALAC|nr:glycoprotein Xg isoform X6 [Balaenoptera acutorostrata]
MGRVSAAAPPESRGRRLNGSPACGAGPSPSRGYRSPRTGCGPPALRVKVTLIWPMLSTTPSPPRSQAQISTQSRGLRTSPSLEIPTTVEISIQGQSQCHVPSLAALTTVEGSNLCPLEEQSLDHWITREVLRHAFKRNRALELSRGFI